MAWRSLGPARTAERRRFGVGMREIPGALASLCGRKLADGASETAFVVRASVSVRG